MAKPIDINPFLFEPSFVKEPADHLAKNSNPGETIQFIANKLQLKLTESLTGCPVSQTTLHKAASIIQNWLNYYKSTNIIYGYKTTISTDMYEIISRIQPSFLLEMAILDFNLSQQTINITYPASWYTEDEYKEMYPVSKSSTWISSKPEEELPGEQPEFSFVEDEKPWNK